MGQAAQDFLRYYNEIDYKLKQLTGERGSVPFWKRLRIAAKKEPCLKRYYDDILECHELRNAIIHHKSYPEEVIAEPAEHIVELMREIYTRLFEPPRVIPAFESDVHVFSPHTPLKEVLQYMYSRGYSQVLSRASGLLKLTTSSGITRWLAAMVNAGEVPFETTTLSAVHEFDRPDAMKLLSRGASVDEALAIFQATLSQKRPRLFAIVITETGQGHEEPLGIITPRDLLGEE